MNPSQQPVARIAALVAFAKSILASTHTRAARNLKVLLVAALIFAAVPAFDRDTLGISGAGKYSENQIPDVPVHKGPMPQVIHIPQVERPRTVASDANIGEAPSQIISRTKKKLFSEALATTGLASIAQFDGKVVDLRPTFQTLLAGYTCEAGTQAIWSMSEVGTPSEWADSCSYGGVSHPLTNNGMTSITGVIGNGASGVGNNWATAPHIVLDLASVGGITEDFWVKGMPMSGGNIAILDDGSWSPSGCGGTGPASGLSVTANGGAKTLSVLTAGANRCTWTDVGGILYDNDAAWHHIAVTWDGTNTAGAMKIYVDGVQRDSGCAAPGFTITTAMGTAVNCTWTVDAVSNAKGTQANAKYDQIRITNGAMSASWIEDEYAFVAGGLVANVTNVSSSLANGSYTTGQVVPVVVSMGKVAYVTGSPRILLETGTTDRFATYASGSGTTNLVFNYTVVAGDSASDLNYVATNSLQLNGGTIKDIGGNNFTLTLPALAGANSLATNKNIVIDTVAPVVAEVTPVPDPTGDTTPDYTFSSTEAGTITYGGSCASADTTADPGNNSVTFNALANGTYSNCTVRVTDAAGNQSNIVNVSTFTVDPLANTCPTSGDNVTISTPCSLNASAPYIFTGTLTIDATVTINSNHPSVGQVVINSDNIVITDNGSLNGDNKGYDVGAGPGGADLAAFMGGTHGGKGGSNNDAVNGSVLAPTEAGSGAGHGSPGGGSIKLHANNAMTIDGDVLMRSVAVGGCAYSGGAGGSVWIETQSLDGTGLVSANGGNGHTCGGGTPNGGGGGRVAVYYASGSPAVTFEASGGVSASGSTGSGGAGTVYIHGPSSTLGSLFMDNSGLTAGQATNLPNGELEYDTLTLNDGSALEVTSGQSLNISSTASLTSTGARSHLLVATGGTFNPGDTSLTLTNVDLTNNGTVTGLTDVVLASSTLTEGGTSFPSLTSLTVNSGGVFSSANDADRTITNVVVASGGMLTHLANNNAQAYGLSLITSSFDLQNGGTINLNGRGYASTFGPGGGEGVGAGGAGGAGHGGLGGNGNTGAGGAIYDDTAAPILIGSGGGNFGVNPGGAGGGRVRVQASTTLNIDGSVTANGANATAHGAGAGSGGSIWLQVPGGTLTGSGVITANGGTTTNAFGGCGAGGYVTFEYLTKTHSGTTQADGGDVNCANAGGDGIVSDQPSEPIITTISPDNTLVGGADFTLTVNGLHFTADSEVRWNGVARPTIFVNGTQLTADISASDISTAATRTVTVFTPAPGGGVSNGVTFTINNPVPTLTDIAPDSATEGDPGFTLTVTGTNFVAGSVVRWEGAPRTTTYVSPTELTANILAGDIATAGTYDVTVFNAAPGGGETAPLTFTVNPPPPGAPTTTSISPSSALVGSASFTLTVNGTDFLPDSVVQWNDGDRPTTYVSATELTAEIDAADLLTAGSFPVTVVNDPGGESNAQSFTVNNPAPSIVQLTPNTKGAGTGAFTIVVDGTGFVPTSTVRWQGSARTTTFVNSTQITAEITGTDIMTAGIYPVSVLNAGPGGGTSADADFAVTNPLPVITSLSPSSRQRNSAAFTLTVNGSDFVNGSVVRWEGADLATTYVSATVLQAQVPSGNLTTVGSFDVTVFNAAPGGGESDPRNFNVFIPSSGGGGSTPPPSGPIAGTPIVLNETTIRWPFTDTSNNETGFKIVDLGGGLAVRANGAANISYLDETGLTPGVTYCNRAVVAVGSAGESTITPSSTFACATLPVPEEPVDPGEQPPLRVVDSTLDSVTLEFGAQYRADITTELIAIRESNTGLYVAPASQTLTLSATRILSWLTSTRAGMHSPAVFSRLLAGEQMYQLQEEPYYQTSSIWPVTVHISSLSPSTEYDFELFEKFSPDAPGVRIYHVVAKTDAEVVEFEIEKLYTGGMTVGNIAVLSYQITIKHVGNVTANNVTLEDLIPYGVTYHTGSMTADGVALTDAIDGDIGEYDAAENGIARWKWLTFAPDTQHVVTVKIDNDGEVADVVNTATATCSNGSCKKYGCGDGVKQNNEVCDAGADNGTLAGGCNKRCSGFITCGDGQIEGPEFCDGNRVVGDKLWRCNACQEWAQCGNGIVETGETCDDGAETGKVGRCNNSCNGVVNELAPPAPREQMCGNGNVEAPEVCDGNRIVGDKLWRCSASCEEWSKCGNGIVETGETCDDGALTGTPEHCNNSCDGIVPFCGNAVVEQGEQCDAGAQSRGGQNGLPNQCSATCSACGDGVKNFNEVCDSGTGAGKIGACNAQCSNIIVCGDGKAEGEEICDGNRLDGERLWRCNACLGWSKCGNGVIEAGETCDDGAETGQVGRCNNSCDGTVTERPQTPGVQICGNGRVEAPEVCDGNRLVNERLWRCTETCDELSQCGNGVIERGETCDDGALTGTPEHCNNSCDGMVPFCGNFIVEAGEQCDAGLQSRGGSNGLPDSCTTSCKACGDATVNFGEFCDEGTTGNGKIDHCNQQCTGIIRCGDGKTEGEEICDKDKVVDGILWRCNACLGWAICGDGVVTPGLESCDDGRRNGMPGRCNRICTGVMPICGDGIVAPSESCDEGDRNGRPGSCNAVCSGPTPFLPDSWLIQLRGRNLKKTVIVEEPMQSSEDVGGEGVDAGSDNAGASEGNGPDVVIDMGDGTQGGNGQGGQDGQGGDGSGGDTITISTDDPAPTITGIAPPGSHVLLYVDGKLVSATRADGDGRYEFTLTEPLAPGRHEIETVIVPDAVADLPAAASVATAAVTGLAALSMAGLANTFGYMLFMFTQPALLFDRKKRRPYGVVFNSLSRLPVDLAIVRLHDAATDRVMQTKVTDPQGRYNFLLKAGEYRLKVTKSGYVFPSVYLRSAGDDIEYSDVLTTPEFRTDKEELVAKSLPVDPVEKEDTPASIQLRRVGRGLRHGIAVSSTLVALAAYLLNPTRLTLSMLLLQVALYGLVVLIMMRRRPKSFGVIQDASGRPLSGAVVRIFDQQFNKLLETQVTDAKGRYAFLVGKGHYYVTATKDGYSTSTSEVIDTTKLEEKNRLVAPNLSIHPQEDNLPTSSPQEIEKEPPNQPFDNNGE